VISNGILARIALGSARPRDLAQLRNACALLPVLKAQLSALETPLLRALANQLGDHADTHTLLAPRTDRESADADP
jgi:DNA mismatch repair protein MutS